jgi:hypothetical protein
MTRILIFCIALCGSVLAQTDQSPIIANPPEGVSIPSIIQSFAANEKEFQQALEHYTFTQNVIVRASCQSAQTGVYHLIVEVGFNSSGKRFDKVKTADSTLQCIQVTKEDFDSFLNQSLFALTPDEIQDYQINFVGQQQQNGLKFYVFDVSPTAVPAGKQSFEGRIWVDARDFAIAKTHGKFTPTGKKKHKDRDNLFPAITTWRERIDGRYLFPAQSLAHEILHFSTGDVQIDEEVNFTDYKAVAHP